MELRSQTQQRSGPLRPLHPIFKELVGGVELQSVSLLARPDAKQISDLPQLFANAEYWLSFDVAAFEPMLARSPSPIRELGVAILLRYGVGIDRQLTLDDIAHAKKVIFDRLPDDLRTGIDVGLATLEQAIKLRDGFHALEKNGFRHYMPTPSLSVHALRAMERSAITIEGYESNEKRPIVPLGKEIILSATDERGRGLTPPEVENLLDAPLCVKDAENGSARTIILMIPGEYVVRVPGRATGERKLFAR